MCLTIPVQVKEVKGKIAIVKRGEEEFPVDVTLLPDIKPEDWLLVISGLALKKVSEEDAAEILEFLEYSFITDPRRVSKRFTEIIQESKFRPLRKEEIIYLLETEGYEKEALLSEANMARKITIRDFICIHGVVEFSNYCKNDCLYCGLQKSARIERYRMEKDEIVARVIEVVRNKGYKLLVLQSGEDEFYSGSDLAEVVREIKSQVRVFIFLSCGERGEEFYGQLRQAGASGILLRFETSNPNLFAQLHPNGKSLSRRLAHLSFLRKMGYFLATGFLVGLPGQTIDDIAEDILTILRLNPEMVSIGPFLPSPHTPLANFPPPELDLVLKTIAVLRLLHKRARIPVSTALETLSPEGRKRALQSGANALMFILTPERYRPLYALYPNRYGGEEEIWEKYGLFKYERSYDMLEERLKMEIENG
jgi:biotin synthase